jgi:hypothetical protein
MFRSVSGLAAIAVALVLALGAAPHAAADSRSDCEAAVREKLAKKAPKAKKLKFSSKVKTVSDSKKGRDELSGTAKYVGAGGESKEMGWKCVVKGGKIQDVNLKLEQ